LVEDIKSLDCHGPLNKKASAPCQALLKREKEQDQQDFYRQQAVKLVCDEAQSQYAKRGGGGGELSTQCMAVTQAVNHNEQLQADQDANKVCKGLGYDGQTEQEKNCKTAGGQSKTKCMVEENCRAVMSRITEADEEKKYYDCLRGKIENVECAKIRSDRVEHHVAYQKGEEARMIETYPCKKTSHLKCGSDSCGDKKAILTTFVSGLLELPSDHAKVKRHISMMLQGSDDEESPPVADEEEEEEVSPAAEDEFQEGRKAAEEHPAGFKVGRSRPVDALAANSNCTARLQEVYASCKRLKDTTSVSCRLASKLCDKKKKLFPVGRRLLDSNADSGIVANRIDQLEGRINGIIRPIEARQQQQDQRVRRQRQVSQQEWDSDQAEKRQERMRQIPRVMQTLATPDWTDAEIHQAEKVFSANLRRCQNIRQVAEEQEDQETLDDQLRKDCKRVAANAHLHEPTLLCKSVQLRDDDRASATCRDKVEFSERHVCMKEYLYTKYKPDNVAPLREPVDPCCENTTNGKPCKKDPLCTGEEKMAASRCTQQLHDVSKSCQRLKDTTSASCKAARKKCLHSASSTVTKEQWKEFDDRVKRHKLWMHGPDQHDKVELSGYRHDAPDPGQKPSDAHAIAEWEKKKAAYDAEHACINENHVTMASACKFPYQPQKPNFPRNRAPAVPDGPQDPGEEWPKKQPDESHKAFSQRRDLWLKQKKTYNAFVGSNEPAKVQKSKEEWEAYGKADIKFAENEGKPEYKKPGKPADLDDDDKLDPTKLNKWNQEMREYTKNNAIFEEAESERQRYEEADEKCQEPPLCKKIPPSFKDRPCTSVYCRNGGVYKPFVEEEPEDLDSVEHTNWVKRKAKHANEEMEDAKWKAGNPDAAHYIEDLSTLKKNEDKVNEQKQLQTEYDETFFKEVPCKQTNDASARMNAEGGLTCREEMTSVERNRKRNELIEEDEQAQKHANSEALNRLVMDEEKKLEIEDGKCKAGKGTQKTSSECAVYSKRMDVIKAQRKREENTSKEIDTSLKDFKRLEAEKNKEFVEKPEKPGKPTKYRYKSHRFFGKTIYRFTNEGASEDEGCKAANTLRDRRRKRGNTKVTTETGCGFGFQYSKEERLKRESEYEQDMKDYDAQVKIYEDAKKGLNGKKAVNPRQWFCRGSSEERAECKQTKKA